MDMNEPAAEKLGIKEVAKRLGKSEKQVRRYIADGKLPAEKVQTPFGERWEVPVDALDGLEKVVQAVVVQGAPPTPQALAMAMAEILDQRTAGFQEILKQTNAEIAALRDQHSVEVAEITALRGEIEDLRKELSARQPWWKRVLGLA